MPDKNTVRYLADESMGVELVHASGSGMRYPLHTHVSTHTVLLVRRGRVYLATDEGERVLRAGDCLAIPPHRLHSLSAFSRYETFSLCVHVATMEMAPASVSLLLSRLVSSGLLRKGERSKLLSRLRAAPRPDNSDDALARLKDALLDNPERDMDLAAMAALVHVEKHHLIRLFKKRYGLTPHGFLTQSRLRKARGLMAGRTSLTGAALRAGFYDQSHFIRHFKRLLGMSPRRYLRCRGALPPART